MLVFKWKLLMSWIHLCSHFHHLMHFEHFTENREFKSNPRRAKLWALGGPPRTSRIFIKFDRQCFWLYWHILAKEQIGTQKLGQMMHPSIGTRLYTCYVLPNKTYLFRTRECNCLYIINSWHIICGYSSRKTHFLWISFQCTNSCIM